MKTVKFGALPLGELPRVVGTLLSMNSLQDFAGKSEKFCDIAEVRVDEIGAENPWLQECQRIEASGMPVIATLRTATEGGKSQLSNEERLDILRRTVDHVSAIDVELESGLAEPLSRLAARQKKALIVSFHDFKGTPPYLQLETTVRKAARPDCVAKISTMVRDTSDIEVLKRLLAQDWGVPLCVIGMGDLGASTRSAFPLLGSCLTYGYLDTPAAPGQLSARVLFEHLCRTMPTYKKDYLARNKVFP